jgi:hypothetical protein
MAFSVVIAPGPARSTENRPMRRMVRYRPLDGLGEVQIDFNACKCSFSVYGFPFGLEEPKPAQIISVTHYQTPAHRWLERILEFPYGSLRSEPNERFVEVSSEIAKQDEHLSQLPASVRAERERERNEERKRAAHTDNPEYLLWRITCAPVDYARAESLTIVTDLRHRVEPDSGSIKFCFSKLDRFINVSEPTEATDSHIQREKKFAVLCRMTDRRWFRGHQRMQLERTPLDRRYGNHIVCQTIDAGGCTLDYFSEIEPVEAASILWTRFGRLPRELDLSATRSEVEIGRLPNSAPTNDDETLSTLVAAQTLVLPSISVDSSTGGEEGHRSRITRSDANTSTSQKGGMEPNPKAGRLVRKFQRGQLDQEAVAILVKNPTLSVEQVASALGCSAKTLRDRSKCPQFVETRRIQRAQREAYRHGSTWDDRRFDKEDV